MGQCVLGPGTNYELNIASYEILGAVGETSLLFFCNTVSIPPSYNVVIVGGQSRTPVQEDGTVTAIVEVFSRGDCNGDGIVNIADPIFTGAYLFSGRRRPSTPNRRGRTK